MALAFALAGCITNPAEIHTAGSVQKVRPSEDMRLSVEENIVPLAKSVKYLPSGVLPAARNFIIDDYDNLWLMRMRDRKGSRPRPLTLICYDTKLAAKRAYLVPASVARGLNPDNVLLDDRRGNIWIGGSSLVRFDKASELFTDFPLPGSFADSGAGPILSMTRPGDGRVWLARSDRSSLEVFDPETSRFKEVPLPLGTWRPKRLLSNDLGHEVWIVTGPKTQAIDGQRGLGRVAVSTFAYTNVKIAPVGVGVEADGDVIYSLYRKEHVGPVLRLKRLDRKMMISQPLGLEGGIPRVQAVLVGPSRRIWLVVPGGLKRITPGSATVDSITFGLPTRPSDAGGGKPREERGRYLYGMAEDSAGDLWFSDVQSGKTGVVHLPAPKQ